MFVVIVLVLLGILLVRNVRIVPQAYCYVIERLGVYHTTWNAGLHLKIPFIDRIANKISLKEQVMDFPPQGVITKDNVTMSVDSVVYARVVDPKAVTYGIENAMVALQNLTATTLRNIIGDMELDDTLSSRESINARMQVVLDEATDPWGLKVTRVEVKNITPPAEIAEVMTTQMRAERDRRETILQAEAHQTSVVKQADGDKKAKILQAEAERDAQIALAEGRAKAIALVYEAEAKGLEQLKQVGITREVLQLRGISAMKDIADGQATKIFIPTDLCDSLGQLGVAGDLLGTAPGPDRKALPREQLRKNEVKAGMVKKLANDLCLDEQTTPQMMGASVRNAAMASRQEHLTGTSKRL